MNGDWRYYFTDYFPSDGHCSRGDLTIFDLGVLDDISNRVPPKPDPYLQLNTNAKQKAKSKPKNKQMSLMFTIPLNTEAEGPLVIEPDPEWKQFHHWDTSLNDIFWTETKAPGRGLNITSVALQQESTVTSKTHSAHFQLDTPYISLPDDIIDLLFLATRPQRVEVGRGLIPVDTVSCNATSKFPTIKMEFEEGQGELVVRPEQYVLRVNQELGGPFAGKCVLLTTRGGNGEVSLGFAALRGRSIWLDWYNARTGFQM